MISNVLLSVSNITVLWVKYIFEFMVLILFHEQEFTRSLKMLIAQKRKYVHKTLREDVATKYGVPKNTLSTWVKSKEKLFAALEKGNNVKGQKLHTGDHETWHSCLQMVFKFAKSKRPNDWLRRW